MGEAAGAAVLAAMARQAARRYGTPLYRYDLGRLRPPEIGLDQGRLRTLRARGSLDRLP